jgi:signal transduction histidine kinase
MSDTATIEEVVKVMGPRDVGVALLVSASGKLTGICTDTDLAYTLFQNISHNVQINNIMTKNPITVGPNASLEECAEKMKQCRNLPVMLGDKIMGVIDILKVQKFIAGELREHVTNLKTAHEQIKRRDEYLGIVAHDVRSPLGVIKICADMLELLMNDKSLGFDQAELIDRIKFNAERAMRLVSDILDIGRLDKGFKLTFTMVNVKEYIEPIVENLRFTAIDRKVKIVTDINPDVWVSIDKERFREILVNIIQNAIKFTATNSFVAVNASFVSTHAGESGTLKIDVVDQGPGIADDKLMQLFNKYVQLEGEARHLGFGLGLSIAQAFTHLHDGEISVKSKVGKGSTFTVSVPRAELRGK